MTIGLRPTVIRKNRAAKFFLKPSVFLVYSSLCRVFLAFKYSSSACFHIYSHLLVLIILKCALFNLQATKLFIVTSAIARGLVTTPLDFVLGSRYCIV